MPIHWLTTAPNPRSSAKGYDAGQRGWKRHAIECEDSTTFKEIRFWSAACGTRGAHGWSSDMFIEDKCARCILALAKRIKQVKEASPC